jgi:hypothetical protein
VLSQVRLCLTGADLRLVKPTRALQVLSTRRHFSRHDAVCLLLGRDRVA